MGCVSTRKNYKQLLHVFTLCSFFPVVLLLPVDSFKHILRLSSLNFLEYEEVSCRSEKWRTCESSQASNLRYSGLTSVMKLSIAGF